jgi:aspartate aminotransferase
MLERLDQPPADKILALMQEFRADPRPDKIDLGVGVYRTPEGVTPVMRAIRAAERQLWEAETTKTYTGVAGEPAFHAAMADLILGPDRPTDRLAAAATPGGTGAVRQCLDLIRLAAPEATVWLSAPTWPTHQTILRYLGMPMAEYRYFDDESRGVDFEAMLADLDRVRPGDAVVLHGCCHNPTGANLTLPQWGEVAALLEARQALPLVDLAYQGFGDGLDADAAGVRLLAARLPELLIAASCSKNFGVYRERAGLTLALCAEPAAARVIQGRLGWLNRQTYSFPPDHGARLVTMVLEDPALRADWQAELEEVRRNMLALRTQLAETLRDLAHSDRFAFVAQHRGMFSRLGASPEQVARMRADHGIYMVGDSRVNIAGLNRATVPILAEAIVKAGV